MLEDKQSLEKAALALYYYAAQQLKAGKSDGDIHQDLMSKGVSAERATQMLARLRQSSQRMARQAGYRHMGVGAINLVLGFSLLLGGIGGIVSILAWTAMGIGFAFFARGMLKVIG
jgi:hypothetical protein